MGRRSDHSREELVALALGAARAIIAEEGVAALTARRLARDIGYSPGTIYNLFENLDDVVLHVHAETLDAFTAHFNSVPMSGALEADLGALLEAYFEFVDGHVELWAALLEYNRPSDMEAPDWFIEKIEAAIGTLARAFGPLYRGGDPLGAKRDAVILWAAVHGLLFLRNTRTLQAVIEEDAQSLGHTLLDYFVAGARATRG